MSRYIITVWADSDDLKNWEYRAYRRLGFQTEEESEVIDHGHVSSAKAGVHIDSIIGAIHSKVKAQNIRAAKVASAEKDDRNRRRLTIKQYRKLRNRGDIPKVQV